MSGTSESIVIVYTLYGDRHAAEKAAAMAVEARLAACANLLAPATSYYIWQGNAEKQAEYPLLFKTSAARQAALMAWIAETHSYDVPAISAWPAEAAPSFARWVGDATVEGA